MKRRLIFTTLLAVAGCHAAEVVDFNRDILPILSDACFHCHGPDSATREARLRLDQHEGIFRTRDGISVVTPGKPEASELVLRISSQHEDEVMPPPDSNRRLAPAERDLLTRWVASGAPWGTHWAFQPPQRPRPAGISAPAIAALVRNPIDAFVFARLERENLAPSPEAAPETLLRRVTFDLTGLPPTPVEIAEFLADGSPGAYERVVDRLLASPRYGERWAWDWLDAARYADTNGFQGDPERTMWPWRDWVVNALNANMPFDRFTLEQLAGDLLPNAQRDQKLATGFHRNNMANGEGGRIAEETRVENVFDRVETTATTWLGLTFTCARCHDHKYDPITQKDYYAMYDIFNQMSETGGASGGAGRSGQIPPVLDMATQPERDAQDEAFARHEQVAREVAAYEVRKFAGLEARPTGGLAEAVKPPGNILLATLAKTEPQQRSVASLREAFQHFRESDPEYSTLLKKLFDALRARDAASARFTRVMIMDELKVPRETFVLDKGNYENKTKVRVFGAIPAMFQKTSPSPSALPDEHPGESARPDVRPAGELTATAESQSRPFNRLDLARWLVSPENPLVARVTVNRVWQAFFGTGIVKTAEDFGVQSAPPSHPDLLDWLATEFVARAWDMKALHRLIATSATYRQSSRLMPGLYERDPENRLLARGPRFRLPSWMLRDQALAASGLLVEQLGGPGVNSYQPAGIWEEVTFGKKIYKQDHGEALYRRSLYVFWRRIIGPTVFFDAGARQVCTVKMARTNTPLHALVTLNDITYVEAARVMAQRVLAVSGRDSGRIDHAFRILTARRPSPKEREILVRRLEKLRAEFAATPELALQLASVGESPRPTSLDPVEHGAWTALCSLIMNLDEVLSKE